MVSQKSLHLISNTFNIVTDVIISSNMLYPKENRQTHELMFACSTCQYSEKAASSCVFRNNLDTSIGETAGVTQDVGSDPTVGVPGFCLLCRCPIRCSFCDEMTEEGMIFDVEVDDDDEDYEDEEMTGMNGGYEDEKSMMNGVESIALGEGITSQQDMSKLRA